MHGRESRLNNVLQFAHGMVAGFHDPLYRNTFFITLTFLSSAGIGFLFWVLAAHYYSKDDVGIATALISLLLLTIALSRLGLDQSLVRFFPDGNTRTILTTSIVVTTLASAVIGSFLLAGMHIFSSRIELSVSAVLIYFVSLIAASITSVLAVAFVALRKAEHYFLQNLIVNSKILFLLPFASLGAIGVFSSVGLAYIVALAISLLILLSMGIRPGGFDTLYLRNSLSFSSGNYIVTILTTAPVQFLPIMILAVLGPDDAADYFLSLAIASILFIIPSAFGTSLFVEGSHGISMHTGVRRSLSTMYLILTPLVFSVVVFGDRLLSIIGEDYLEAFDLMRVLALSTYFVGFFSIYSSLMKVQKRIGVLIRLSVLFSTGLIVLTWLFMMMYGVIGVGYAWFSSYGLCSFIALARLKHEGYLHS